jgi:hypothetical protein
MHPQKSQDRTSHLGGFVKTSSSESPFSLLTARAFLDLERERDRECEDDRARSRDSSRLRLLLRPRTSRADSNGSRCFEPAEISKSFRGPVWDLCTRNQGELVIGCS